MKSTMITLGYIRYLVERENEDDRSLYLYKEDGEHEYLGTWHIDNLEQAASRIHQRLIGISGLQITGGISAEWLGVQS